LLCFIGGGKLTFKGKVHEFKTTDLQRKWASRPKPPAWRGGFTNCMPE
jgi:hypothetical protein